MEGVLEGVLVRVAVGEGWGEGVGEALGCEEVVGAPLVEGGLLGGGEGEDSSETLPRGVIVRLPVAAPEALPLQLSEA